MTIKLLKTTLEDVEQLRKAYCKISDVISMYESFTTARLFWW